MNDFDVIERKMESVGLSQAAIGAFRHSVNVLTSQQSMMIPEAEIAPADDVADWESLTASTPEADAELLGQAVLIKLNGGLGTGMGLQKAKSLLEIKPGVTFLDLIVRQVMSLRRRAGCPVMSPSMDSCSRNRRRLLSRPQSSGCTCPAR